MNILLIVTFGLILFMISILSIYILIYKSIYNKKQKVRRCFILCVIEMFIFVLLHYIMLGYVNILWTIKCIYNKWIDYHMIDNYVYVLSLYCVVVITIIVGTKVFYRQNYLCMSIYEKCATIGTFSIGGLLSISLLYMSYGAISNIKISEVLADNYSIILEDGNISDYIELYNEGGLGCDLRTLYLSDDVNNLKKMSLNGQYLKEKEYLLIPLNDKTEFMLSKKGEYIYLSDEYGNILQEICCEFEDRDYSYALNEDTGEYQYRKGTPGRKNTEGELWIKPPSFEIDSGIYEDEFLLNIECDKDCKIYYTLDCTTPTDKSLEYTDAIRVYDKSTEENVFNAVQNVVLDWERFNPTNELVDKGFVIKAIACDEDGNTSKVITKTYWINKDELKDKLLISLVVEPEDLYGDDGIYVTGKLYDEWYLNGQNGEMPEANFLRDIEVPADITFIDKKDISSQKVGIKVQGASSRTSVPKRLSVFARKIYNDNVLSKKLFGDVETHSIYFVSDFANTLGSGLVSDRNVAVQNSREAVVYLNGEFLYNTYVTEKYNEKFFEQYYDIDEEEFVLIKNSSTDKGNLELAMTFPDVYTYIKNNDMSDNTVYQEYGKILNIQSYIDYACINLYLCNMDYSDTKNMIAFLKDDKWNYAIYDIDSISWNNPEFYGVEKVAQIDSFSKDKNYAGKAFNKGLMFTELKKNAVFRKQFVLTFMDLVNENFSINNVSKYLEESGYDLSWCNYFFVERAKYIVPYMAKEFELNGTLEEVEICSNNINGGKIKLNTITPTLVEGKWSGQYYTDYSITVSVEVADGYVFEGFSGDYVSSEQEIEVQVKEGGIKLYANFKEIE